MGCSSPLNELPRTFLKSIIANEKRSFAFILVASYESTPCQPWIFNISKVIWLKCMSPLTQTILHLDEVGEDPRYVVGKHLVLGPLDHLGLQVVVPYLLDKNSHGCAGQLVPSLECPPILLVDLPINNNVHLQHELVEFLDDRHFFFVLSPFVHCIAGGNKRFCFRSWDAPNISLWSVLHGDVKCSLSQLCLGEALQSPKEFLRQWLHLLEF